MHKAFSQVKVLAKGLYKSLKNHSAKRFYRTRQFAYSYHIISHDKISCESEGLKKTTLVGENWRASRADGVQPIMLMMGFNSWKLGFVSAYLLDYRTAFLPRKMPALMAARVLWKCRELSQDLMIWGYNEAHPLITRLAKKWGYTIHRMEDGFVRSVELGANHSTPYSLVTDKKGLYFNPLEPSELEDILNTDLRLQDQQFLATAEKHLNFIIHNSITKYNGQRGAGEEFAPVRQRPAVLVIGQVPGDASLKFGNPDRWTIHTLISLARNENPGCEVIYRPHPDVYNKPARYKENHEAIAKLATIVPPSVGLLDLMASMRRVYTISSLVGMEAVMRNIPVTTVGLPFYAGWGVTDDRCSIQMGKATFSRRTAKLSALQLFAGAYLLYAKYLASQDSDEGLTAACMKIIGERQLKRPPVKLPVAQAKRKELLENIARSDDWAMAFSQAVLARLDARDLTVFVRSLDLSKIFVDQSAHTFQVAFICRIVGLLSSWSDIEEFLGRARLAASGDVFSSILDLPWGKENAERLVRSETSRKETGTATQRWVGRLAAETQNEVGKVSEEQANSTLSSVQSSFRTRQLNEVLSGCFELLLSNRHTEEAMQLLIEASSFKLEFSSAAMLAEFDFRTGDLKYRSRNLARMITALRYVYPFNAEKFLWAVTARAVVSPESIWETMEIAERMKAECDVDSFENIFLAMMLLDNDITLGKAKGWISLERPEKALPILIDLHTARGETVPLLVALSQAYSYSGDFLKAREICLQGLSRYGHVNLFKEAMRVAITSGDIAWGEDLLESAKDRGVAVGEISRRKIFYGARRIQEALHCAREISLHKEINTYYPDHYIDPDMADGDFRSEDVFFLNVFGPGDEIRYAQIYADIAEDPDFGRYSIACDPRLEQILQRSFPGVHFVPVNRVAQRSAVREISRYSRLPSFELCEILDNNGHSHLLNSDRALLIVDLLAKYRRSYADFRGDSFLRVDRTKSEKFRCRLPQDRLLVGISWRSSISKFSRNLHYLRVEELASVFGIDGVQFVNLQYDECREELAWIEARFPGKIVDFADLDQFNDFDSVASLMSELDLVIAPATTVAELAGACGVKTWLLSNTVELDGRKVDEDSLVDVWHSNMTHVEGAIRGDKMSLVASLHDALVDFVKTHRTARIGEMR
ncbi:capsular polysaccharide export protein, LipB/KpsS family [Sinorhizobium chiapasense]|uniref:Uncharacterized protein n=1 Tax=Sinorhizobium chiapasense TaxID=501572 RepID=A0ABZ2BMQ0_9HYPH